MNKNIRLLLKDLNIPFHNLSLYELAFTHSSYNADAHTFHHDYERMEFLGDSVLGFVIASLVYKTYPELGQGDLSKLRSALVKTSSLANYARKYNFQDYIKVGNSYANDLAKSDNVLEDVFEAFIAAIYLDLGFKSARNFINLTFYDDVLHYDLNQIKDYKSRLQEEMQAEYRDSVTYEVVKESGPSHKKTFTVCVKFDDVILGYGVGRTKKEAESNAAKEALSKKALLLGK